MDNNYWQEYWDNYYKFMAVYLGGLQENYNNVDMKKEYLEVSRLFEPPMTPEGYNNSTQNNTNMPTNDALSTEYYTMPGMGNNMQQGPGPVIQQNNTDNTMQQPTDVEGPGPVILPDSDPSSAPVSIQQGGLQVPIPLPFISTGSGQAPESFISPDGGQFTINNCRRMAVVRIEMRREFNPNNFHMLVDRADRRSIQGFRIACQNNQIRFIPMALDYRNINVIECVF
nr:hypothetical protein [uncultured Terrisporobacter sp.]